MEIRIGEVIRNKRRELDWSQEVLAEKIGVTVQAVSKWETALSYPDVTLLPKIAECLKISMDDLFFGRAEGQCKQELSCKEIPDDNKLRVVQCLGRKVLGNGEAKEKFKLIIPETEDKSVNFEVWGSAEIEGDVNGNVNAGAGIACGNVGGYAEAGAAIACGNVGGAAQAGASISCGNVGGEINSGNSVNCGNVSGDINTGGKVSCGNVEGDIEAGGEVKCKEVKGNVTCEKITYED